MKREETYPIQGSFNTNKSQFLIKIMEVEKQWDKILKKLGWGGRKTVNYNNQDVRQYKYFSELPISLTQKRMNFPLLLMAFHIFSVYSEFTQS